MRSRFQLYISLVLLAAAALLPACTQAPIHIKLDDFRIQIDAVGYTAGQVIYPKEPTHFEDRYPNVKTVTVTGVMKAEFTPVQSPLVLSFYARVNDPAASDNCVDAVVAWVCDAEGELVLSRSYTVTNGAAQPFSLGDNNRWVLAEGVNRGEIWIGARVTSGIALDATFEFTDMVATVTLF